jgi:hypothetical protein
VYVDERGGRVTSTFEATIFPDSIHPISGPFRRRGARAPTRDSTPGVQGSALLNLRSRDASLNTSTGYNLISVTYLDQDVGYYRALPSVPVNIDVYDTTPISLSAGGRSTLTLRRWTSSGLVRSPMTITTS